jgi:hypothetical protein
LEGKNRGKNSWVGRLGDVHVPSSRKKRTSKGKTR